MNDQADILRVLHVICNAHGASIVRSLKKKRNSVVSILHNIENVRKTCSKFPSVMQYTAYLSSKDVWESSMEPVGFRGLRLGF